MIALLSFLICLISVGSADLIIPERRVPQVKAEIQAAHFLNQATLGATPQSIKSLAKEIERVGEAKALKGWIADQVTRSPRSLAKHYQQHLSKQKDSSPIMGHEWYRRQDAFWWDNALTGSDELRKRVAWALSQILVASAKGVPAKSLGGLHYYDTLSLSAFENYETLLQAVTYSPVMGKFLNSAKNAKANGKRFANENYARELLQLFSLGVYQRAPDGAYILDAKGNKKENYSIADVKALSRILTGLNYVTSNGELPKRFFKIRPNMHASMLMDQKMHDVGKKTFLGETFEAHQEGSKELQRALSLIAQHPSTSVHISVELIKKLTTSNPSAAYISRVVAAWRKSSGDLQTVVSAILLDPEARGSLLLDEKPYGKGQTFISVRSASPTYGRLKEPVLLLSQFYRSLGAKPSQKTLFCPTQVLNRLTYQRPLYQKSVFNDFSSDFAPQTGPVVESKEKGARPLILPEFELLPSNVVTLEGGFLRLIRRGKVPQLKPYSPVPLRRLTQWKKKKVSSKRVLHWLNLYCCNGSIPMERQKDILKRATELSPHKKQIEFVAHSVINSADYAISN